jgi:hypothetical protein
MSGLDIHAELGEQHEEIKTRIDDWWCQLFAIRIAAPLPDKKVKARFIEYIMDTMYDSGSSYVSDNDLSILFSNFIEDFVEW